MTPYWAVATAVVMLCIPVQAIAFVADVARAITGAPPAREIGMGESGDSDLAERA